VNITEISKFLSYVLRHKPEAIGLTLDIEGWAPIEQLLAGAAKDGKALDRKLLQTIVDTSDKKRFAISDDGLRIRAVQGHSTNSVSISWAENIPPDVLYHGTAERFVESIRKQGLIAGARQYVHLSIDREAAGVVGQRYGKPVVIIIEALRMHREGFKFYQAENGVWLTVNVPPEFLAIDHP
jgi:putative RNA 2'-phosphotransferase